jgi:hypothetical protein
VLVSFAPGTQSLQAAWQTLQENAEKKVVRVMAGQASSFLGQARGANWLPDLPPKATAGHSTYITEVLEYLEVGTPPCAPPPHTHMPFAFIVVLSMW